MRGWAVPEIGAELAMPVNRVSDEKYKALRKLEHHLRSRCEELGIGPVVLSASRKRNARRPVLSQAACSRGAKAGGSTTPRNLALLDLVTDALTSRP